MNFFLFKGVHSAVFLNPKYCYLAKPYCHQSINKGDRLTFCPTENEWGPFNRAVRLGARPLFVALFVSVSTKAIIITIVGLRAILVSSSSILTTYEHSGISDLVLYQVHSPVSSSCSTLVLKPSLSTSKATWSPSLLDGTKTKKSISIGLNESKDINKFTL